jgi:hypothetical protein
MRFELIYAIMSHFSLKLRDENSLYEFIKSLVIDKSQYSRLFGHVLCGYLSRESMYSFIEMIRKSFEFLTLPIWDALCDPLSFSVSRTTSNDRLVESSNSAVCSYQEGASLDGIVSYLAKNFYGYVRVRGVVSIRASSLSSPQSCLLRNVTDFENQTHSHTSDTPNAWICYDFKSMNIKPTHYTLHSLCNHYLRLWTLEGSLDGSEPIELDHRENKTELNSQRAIATFPVSRSDKFHMIRLRQLGKNSNNNDHLVVNAIEAFGVLMESNQ